MKPPVCAVMAAALGTYLLTTPATVRAERDPSKPAEPVASRFEIEGATVYDKTTNLTWMRCSYGQQWADGGCSGPVLLLDWDSAMGLHRQDDTAWRLPERDELQSIVVHSCKRPAVDATVFPGTASIQYWTSTTSGPSYAWVVYFRTGMPTWNMLRSSPFAVRLVRVGR